jgi:tRNA uridine 5-carboxymethylaminomethyl modification enzyme
LQASPAGEACPDLSAWSETLLRQVEIETKYEGYVRRQQDEIEKIRRHEGISLPPDLAYDQVPGLSAELSQKLADVRPDSLARAARIPGMTPAALSILLVHVRARAAAPGEPGERLQGLR